MRIKIYFFTLLMFVNINCVFAAAGEPVGRIKTAVSPAHISRGPEKIAAKPGLVIIKSDTLVTGKQGSLGIVFNDNSTLALGSNSIFNLTHYEFNVLDKKVGFVGKISRGSMVYLSGLIAKMNADAVRFETPAAVAGIKGTKLGIMVEGDDNE